MHAEQARGCRHIAAGLVHRLLDVFPLQAADRCHRVGHFHFAIVGRAVILLAQSAKDHRYRGWLGQVIVRTELDRFHRSGDAGVAGHQQDAHVRAQRTQRLDQRQAGIAAQLQVDQGERGWVLARQCQRAGGILRGLRFKPLAGQAALQGAQVQFVVVDQQAEG